MINILQLMQNGASKQQQEKADQEATKAGYLRGGNSGSLVETNEGLGSIGGCARKAFLRMLGIELPDDEDYQSKVLMFQLGISNEESITEFLKLSWPGGILRESEVPTRWETTNGTPVSGRPDVVLTAETGNATTRVVGLEIKQASSLWTCRDILADRPKTEHLAQAAHYSWQLGIPFVLVYTNRVNFALLGNHLPWVSRQFPKYGTRHSDKLDYELGKESAASPEKVYKNGKVKAARPPKPGYMEPFRIRPFAHTFRLTWKDDGRLWVGPEDLPQEEDKQTLISQDGIKEFYESAANAITTDQLPPRPLQLTAFNEDAKYTNCKYCPLQNLCDNYQGGTAGWLQEVKKQVDAADVNK